MRIVWLLSPDGKYLYAEHNKSIRADLAGNVYGGGFFSDLFGGDEDVEIPRAEFKTAQQLFDEALNFASREFPLATRARESALQDISSGTQFYEGFQPTTLEQAIANTAFGNLLEQAQRRAGQIGSLAGIESNIPAIFTREITPGLVNIGQYLANLGQQRAIASLNARLGIDPFAQLLNPFVGVGQQQANLQTQADFQHALAEAQQEQAGLGGGSGLTSAIGAGLGALFALPTGGMSVPMGAMLGGALGGTAGSIFGGGQSPVSFGDVLAYQQAQNLGNLFNQYPGATTSATTLPVFTGNTSLGTPGFNLPTSTPFTLGLS